MARPKSATTPAQIQAAIARARRDAEAQVKQLEVRLREAQARENQRRGELISQYLAGPKGGDLRRVLRALVDVRDVDLFGLGSQTSVLADVSTRAEGAASIAS
jgi:hypothetical protein